jgi:[NiFe] hydrogenase diaphorase moiety large subunit
MATAFSILEHISGYEAFKIAKDIGAKKVLEEVKNSELRGRGGAGFLTGLKWEMTSFSPGEKIVVCNADEGEMGTFKDRKLLAEYPELLIEGMAICALAIGAKEAIIYLRWEYHFLKPILVKALEEAKKSIPSISFLIVMGGGAYVCGEETSLLDSLEGRRGEPRNKPPFPVKAGYLGRPTAINNVETFCCVPHIIKQGAAAFARIGTKHSHGTKLFTVSGDVAAPGIYEFPMGTPLRAVLRKARAKDAKAALVGGSGGEIVAKKEFDRKLAFEDLPPGGSIIVFGSKRKMVHVLENIMDFFLEESCGQCVPCREGNYRLYRFVRKMIEEKTVTKQEIQLYKDLGNTMKQASKCGLGQTSPNPFLGIIEKFTAECAKIVKL